MNPSFFIPAIFFITLSLPLSLACEDQSMDYDYAPGSCECPDIHTLLNASDMTFKNPVVNRLEDCTYNVTCNCPNNTRMYCGFLRTSLDNIVNLNIPGYTVLGNLDVLINSLVPEDIFKTFGFQCVNGSWYATKFPYGMYFRGITPRNETETLFATSDMMVGVVTKISPQRLSWY